MITIITTLPQIIIRCLLTTIAVELIIALLLGIKNKVDLINIILVNILTNPVVVVIPMYFNLQYGLVGRNICLYILEILAVIVEGFIYFKYFDYKKINPFLISLILNVCSYLVGVASNYLIYGHD